jgi:hypothetical protein
MYLMVGRVGTVTFVFIINCIICSAVAGAPVPANESTVVGGAIRADGDVIDRSRGPVSAGAGPVNGHDPNAAEVEKHIAVSVRKRGKPKITIIGRAIHPELLVQRPHLDKK